MALPCQAEGREFELRLPLQSRPAAFASAAKRFQSAPKLVLVNFTAGEAFFKDRLRPRLEGSDITAGSAPTT